MNNKSVKKIWMILLLSTALIFTGCGGRNGTGTEKPGSTAGGSGTESVSKTSSSSDASASSSDAGAAGKGLRADDTAPSLSSESEIMSFIKGDWFFYDPVRNEDYARLNIGGDGTLTYSRLSQKEFCTGDIFFNRLFADGNAAPDEYRIKLRGITDNMLFCDSGYAGDGTDESRGVYHITSTDGMDYMYLCETGNGESQMAYALFQNRQARSEGTDNNQRGFILRRKQVPAGGITAEKSTGSSFYAFAWLNGTEGLLLQKMEPYTRDETDEYTGRRFTGAYFGEKELYSSWYGISESFDTTLVDKERLSAPAPRTMYYVTTDGSGDIFDMSEVEQTYYNIYDMGKPANGALQKITLLNPGWEYYYYEGSDRAKGGNPTIELEQLSAETSDWLNTDAWSESMGIGLPGLPYNDGIYYYECVNDSDNGNLALNIYDSSRTDFLYSFDLSEYINAPDKGNSFFSDVADQEISFAAIYDDILYISIGHRTYASASPHTAFIVALYPDTGSVIWRSDDQVARASNFLVYEDCIICGYGMTDEPDYIYILNRENGRVQDRIKVKTAPECFIPFYDDEIYVLTYNTEYLYRIKDRAESILGSMSVEDKVAQLFFVTPESLTGEANVTAFDDTTKQALDKYPVGGMIYLKANLLNADQTRQMLAGTRAYYHGISPGYTELLTGIDEEGGRVLRIGGNSGFPEISKISSMEETGQNGGLAVYEAADYIGSYLHDLCFNLDMAPDVDVLTNPDNKVIGNRSFGSDPDLVTSYARQYTEGLHRNSVLSCYKHFPGHGSTSEDTHEGYALVDRTLDELKECDLKPFEDGIKNNIDLIMVTHVSAPKVVEELRGVSGGNIPSYDPGIPVSLSKEIITTLLREDMGYDGVVITDALDMGAISRYYSNAEACRMAFEAGCDMLLMASDFRPGYEAILSDVRSGAISMERLDDSVRRIIKLKLRVN